MQPFRQLLVWRRAHDLADRMCSETEKLPRKAEWLLGDQMRRSARSIYANVAEGCSRESHPDFARFVRMSHGSAAELLGDLLLVQRRGWLPEQATLELIHETEEIMRMLSSLHVRLRRQSEGRSSSSPALVAPQPPPASQK